MTHIEKDDLVERLGYHQEDHATGKLVLRNPDGPEAATRITELQAQLAEAREALKPFADAYVNREKWAEDSYIGGSDLRNRDLRRAARALETTKPRI